MHVRVLEAAVILGMVIPQIFSTSVASPAPDCVAAVDTCLSNLCESEQAFHGGICGDDRCQIKGFDVCNMTIRTVMDQFPSLQGCVCAWEEELCGSIQVLATQCNHKTAAKQKRSTVTDWQTSSLTGYVYDGSGSCLDQMTLCVSDAVCNRYLVPVLQACVSEQCDRDRCREVTAQFYGSMPHNVAEMLVMCECEASDQSCAHMKTALQSGTCGDKTWICQDTVNQCVEDSYCRDVLRTFHTACWSSEEGESGDSNLQKIEYLTHLDPALILGADAECKKAFLATVGTVLHYPCTCEGVRGDDLQTCNMIQSVLHNRSHFVMSLKSSRAPTEPPGFNESAQGLTWSHDYLLYAFTAVLLIGVIVLMPLAVVSKIWMSRRKDKTRFHHSQKSNCVVIL